MIDAQAPTPPAFLADAPDEVRNGVPVNFTQSKAGRPLLPEGWVDSGRRPRSVDPDDGDLYGSHWWTRDNPHGTFWAAGHEGQYIDVCPALDLVLVRMGRTDAEHGEDLKRWRTEVIEAFRAAH